MSRPPFTPQHDRGPSWPISIPMVPMPDASRLESRHETRSLEAGGPPSEADLVALGEDGWELTGMFAQQDTLHLYFKRLS